MSNNSHRPKLSVRPPWRDELQRVPGLTQGLSSSILWNLNALVVEDPQRVVGIAGVGKDGDQGHLHFNVRPRFLNGEGSQLLYDKMMEEARALGIGQLSAQISTDTPLDHFLQAAGFQIYRTEEVWQVDLLKVNKRMQRISKKWKLHTDWNIRGIEPNDLPAIAELVAPYERLGSDRLRIRKEGEPYGNAYEGEPSSVVEFNGKLIGALLTKGTPSCTGYIEFRVVAKEYQEYSAGLGAMMLYRSTIEALKQDYRTVLFTVNMAQDFETLNLAHRMKGRLVRSIRVLHLDLGSA